jgi:hypothetical protein
VVQPITAQQIANGVYGPQLQVAMFAAGEPPDPKHVADFADLARALLNASPPSH